MKDLKLNRLSLLLCAFLLCGCMSRKSSVSTLSREQAIVQYTYIAKMHEFKNSYVYEAMSGDSAITIIQPKAICRKALCASQTYYQLMLEEIHRFEIPSGIPIRSVDEAPYTISYRNKIVYQNGWIDKKTDHPVFFLWRACGGRNLPTDF